MQEEPRRIRPPDIGPKLRKSNIYRENANSATREEFFLNRVILNWNKLPGSVRYAPNVNSFKNGIDKEKKYKVNRVNLAKV